MDSYSLVITSTNQQNQSKTKTIGYIKSDAQPSDLKSAAKQLTALTNNIYESADRVAKENVDTAVDKTNRIISDMKIGNQSVTIADTINVTLASSDFDANNRFYIRFFDNSVQQKNGSVPVWTSDGSVSYSSGANYNSATYPYAWALFIVNSNPTAESFSGVLDLPANDYYNGASYNINITISGGE